jgi:hypothetical protein
MSCGAVNDCVADSIEFSLRVSSSLEARSLLFGGSAGASIIVTCRFASLVFKMVASPTRQSSSMSTNSSSRSSSYVEWDVYESCD